MSAGYRFVEIATVSIVNYTSIIYTIALGFFIFGETFNSMTYLGMALVCSGVIINVMYKNHSERQLKLETDLWI